MSVEHSGIRCMTAVLGFILNKTNKQTIKIIKKLIQICGSGNLVTAGIIECV